MNIFEATNTNPIDNTLLPLHKKFTEDFVETRRPIVIDDLPSSLPFLKEWNMDFFRRHLRTIRVHMPDVDGIYHFLSYRRVPVEEFERNLTEEKTMYSLEPLLGQGSPQGNQEHRLEDIDEKAIPEFIPRNGFRSSNLYIGPGGNKTLLHNDEVQSLLVMLEGEKHFAVFPPDQSRYLYPYHAFDIRSIRQHRVLDSKINPVNIDTGRFPKLARAKGWHGVLKPGQALFIPAGTWHYIESDDPNLAVNYFWREDKLSHWLTRPLLDFWFKRRQVVMLDYARRLREAFRKSDSAVG